MTDTDDTFWCTVVEKLSVDNCQPETIYCREIDIRMTCLTFELRVNQKKVWNTPSYTNFVRKVYDARKS